ncbi:MAG: nucleotidyl transferase AbiEii/AbiGii toxin family protein [Candidatus Bathyarchaeota archaeon]
MRLPFVNEVSKRTGVKRADLIEKDLLLHQILADLSSDLFFSDSFLFKGGTCLIKGYIGYFRFSEDVDFTWRDQSVYEGKSGKEMRRYLSTLIDDAGGLFEEISARRGFDFRCAKRDRNYVELGGSDKICTFKLWYDSEALRWRSFIKVQVNFVEKLLYPPETIMLQSLLTGADARTKREMGLLFPEQSDYLQAIPFKAYEVREMLAEKIRSILTRSGVKARDYVDVYVIGKRFGVKPDDVLDQAMEKIQFTLGLYEKYRRNLDARKAVLGAEPFTWGEERGLLLEEIDETEFYEFLESFNEFILKVVNGLG